MYFENEKQYSRRRSNDEFLRRMQGEEFLSRLSAGSDIPTVARTDIPSTNERPRTSCNGTTFRNNSKGENCGNNSMQCNMPSLAMVYSPLQPWQNMLTPEEGLSRGSIFEELIKPFDGGRNWDCSMGGGCRK